jgi:hypothetical protein
MRIRLIGELLYLYYQSSRHSYTGALPYQLRTYNPLSLPRSQPPRQTLPTSLPHSHKHKLVYGLANGKDLGFP